MKPQANPRPFRPVSPGEILQDELDARQWTQKQLALKIRRPAQAINEIIHARKQITAETALSLAEVFGTSAEMWMNLESNYRLDLARRRRKRAG